VLKGDGSIQLRMMRISHVKEKIEAMECQDLSDFLLHEATKRLKLSHQTR
jgi:hypothetical protein